MKRSRIFLGVTTAMLAIAGIAAAKANRATPVKLFYTVKVNGVWKAVTAPNLQPCTKNGPGAQCKTIIGTTTYQLFTAVNAAHHAIVPAYYNSL